MLLCSAGKSRRSCSLTRTRSCGDNRRHCLLKTAKALVEIIKWHHE